MTERLTLGYREAVAVGDSALAAAGTRVRGHEFHRTAVEPGAGSEPAWGLVRPERRTEGFVAATRKRARLVSARALGRRPGHGPPVRGEGARMKEQPGAGPHRRSLTIPVDRGRVGGVGGERSARPHPGASSTTRASRCAASRSWRRSTPRRASPDCSPRPTGWRCRCGRIRPACSPRSRCRLPPTPRAPRWRRPPSPRPRRWSPPATAGGCSYARRRRALRRPGCRDGDGRRRAVAPERPPVMRVPGARPVAEGTMSQHGRTYSKENQ